MKKIVEFIFLFVVSFLFTSCVKKNNAPTVADNVLNYSINEIPVTADYVVGAFYYNFTTFNSAIKHTPTVGKYAMSNGVVSPSIMNNHIQQAKRGGIDYFLFPFRSSSRDFSNFRVDTSTIKAFVDQNGENFQFALAYNFSNTIYGITNASPLENNAVKLEQFFQDTIRVVPYMRNANYLKVDGKSILYIVNAHLLFSNDNVKIYTTLRSRLKALGIELYIVGMQERWSPPARYPHRFAGCVDAIYHQSYSSQLTDWDRWWLLPQTMDQNWKYSKQYFSANMGGIDYVPNISPAYDWKILQPNAITPNYPRTDDGKMYKLLCNVAKMNASEKTRLILIDSWNKWDEDMQLESATSYGDLYLDITKKQFKRP